jgi:transposase
MTKKCSFSGKSEATIVLEALRGDETAQEIATKHKTHLTQA